MADKQIALEHYQGLAAQAQGLHPVFNDIVRGFMNLSALAAPPESNLQVHYPAVGRRRPYRSLGDAMSYEAGFLSYSPDAPAPVGRTPFSDGWWDAFSAQESRDMHAAERHLDSDDDGGMCVEAA